MTANREPTMPPAPRRRRQQHRHRRGFGLVEMTVTAVLVVVAMGVTVQILGGVARERRSALRRELAVLEAANALERATARPWEELIPDAAPPAELSEAARASLPGAALAVGVQAVEGPVPARRVTVTVRWRDRSGQFEAPVRLVGWVHRRGGGK